MHIHEQSAVMHSSNIQGLLGVANEQLNPEGAQLGGFGLVGVTHECNDMMFGSNKGFAHIRTICSCA